MTSRRLAGTTTPIAVGPAGVFMLDTKWPSGVMPVVDEVPHVRRREDPDADVNYASWRPAALARAARLSEDLRRRTRRGMWVREVVLL
jgi:hypothetical protein